MKKIYIIIGLLLIIIVTILFTVFHRSKNINEDVKLRNQIIETIEQSDSIDFSKITNFQWDTMYIFTPYSIPKDSLEADGIKSYNSNFSIEFLDNINMIAFVNSNKLVSFVELPRKYGGADSTTPVKFSNEQASFTISQKDKMVIFNKKHNN